LGTWDAPVAETVMVYVPAGVPLGGGAVAELLPQPTTSAEANRRKRKRNAVLGSERRCVASSSGKAKRLQRATRKEEAKSQGGEVKPGRFVATLRDVVLMVSVAEAGASPGVTEEGLKLQDAPMGRPEQVKFETAVVYGKSFGAAVRV